MQSMQPKPQLLKNATLGVGLTNKVVAAAQLLPKASDTVTPYKPAIVTVMLGVVSPVLH